MSLTRARSTPREPAGFSEALGAARLSGRSALAETEASYGGVDVRYRCLIGQEGSAQNRVLFHTCLYWKRSDTWHLTSADQETINWAQNDLCVQSTGPKTQINKQTNKETIKIKHKTCHRPAINSTSQCLAMLSKTISGCLPATQSHLA